MKVINVTLEQESATTLSPLEALITEITGMRDSVLGEGKKSPEEQAAAKKKAKEKSKSKAASAKKADAARGNQDTEKADSAEKAEKPQTDTADFKNGESFAPTPEDAHLHTDGKCDDSSLRHNKSAGNYVKHGDLEKNPCDKHYPTFGGHKNEKARIAGGLRQAYARHDEKAIKGLEAAAKAAGMKNVMGASWNERPECKKYQQTKDPANLPTGWTAKMCKPHGQGGGDEWLRSHSSDSKKAKGHRENPNETAHTSKVNRLKAIRATLKSGGEKAKANIGPRKTQGHDTHAAQEKHKDVKHEPTARHRSFQGAGKVYHAKHKKAGQLIMPKDISPSEKARILGNHSGNASKPGEGGRGGELARGARRTLSTKEQAKRKAPNRGEHGEGTKVVRQGAEWHKLSKDRTGKKTKPEGGSHRSKVVPRHKTSRSANRIMRLRGLNRKPLATAGKK